MNIIIIIPQRQQTDLVLTTPELTVSYHDLTSLKNLHLLL
jgi:hypothetical protein